MAVQLWNGSLLRKRQTSYRLRWRGHSPKDIKHSSSHSLCMIHWNAFFHCVYDFLTFSKGGFIAGLHSPNKMKIAKIVAMSIRQHGYIEWKPVAFKSIHIFFWHLWDKFLQPILNQNVRYFPSIFCSSESMGTLEEAIGRDYFQLVQASWWLAFTRLLLLSR